MVSLLSNHGFAVELVASVPVNVDARVASAIHAVLGSHW